jgi:hypothetical protein
MSVSNVLDDRDKRMSTTETTSSQQMAADDILPLSKVIHRFPEVGLIEEMNLRIEVIRTLRHAPKYFWEVPASASKKYHNPFCRGEHGLWMHTKMAVTALERISSSWVQLGLVSEYERDCARAALLLHDMFKQGYPADWDALSDDERTTVKNHDELMAAWCRENTSLPETVIGSISSHNGPWYNGTEPSMDRLIDVVATVRQAEADPESIRRDISSLLVELLVHTCDMAASDPNGTLGLWKPTKEIREKYPNIPRAHFPHAE